MTTTPTIPATDIELLEVAEKAAAEVVTAIENWKAAQDKTAAEQNAAFDALDEAHAKLYKAARIPYSVRYSERGCAVFDIGSQAFSLLYPGRLEWHFPEQFVDITDKSVVAGYQGPQPYWTDRPQSRYPEGAEPASGYGYVPRPPLQDKPGQLSPDFVDLHARAIAAMGLDPTRPYTMAELDANVDRIIAAYRQSALDSTTLADEDDELAA